MARSITPRSFHRSLGAVAALSLMLAAPTAGFAGGTDAQREACTPDAFRLCSTSMPDEKQVETCLRAAGPRLSRGCHEVFYSQEAAAPNQVTRGQVTARVRTSAPDRAPSMPQTTPAQGDDVE